MAQGHFLGLSVGNRHPRARRAGFTLIEVLLTLLLVITLAGLSIISFTALRGTRDMDEAPGMAEGIVRLARAEACNLGRRIRIAIDADSGGLRVLWEPNPLTEPNVFVPYNAASWTRGLTFGSTTVVRCEVVDPNVPVPESSDTASSDAAPAGITFAPDGSSDSAQIEIHSQNLADDRRGMVYIDGLSGMIHSEVLTESDEESSTTPAPTSGNAKGAGHG